MTFGKADLDLVIAGGNELLVVHGRDRKLTLPAEDQAKVHPAEIGERAFPFSIRAAATGEFTGDGFTDIALLTDDGSVEVLAQPGISSAEWQRMKTHAIAETQTAIKIEGVAGEFGFETLRQDDLENIARSDEFFRLRNDR